VLSPEGFKFFNEPTVCRPPTAPIFTEDGSRTWERHAWAEQFRAARDKVSQEARGKDRIPSSASAYTFRHARISELLQVHGIALLTVAVQTGTSSRMIEQAYHRFIVSAMREKLSAIRETT
jgi:integrase